MPAYINQGKLRLTLGPARRLCHARQALKVLFGYIKEEGAVIQQCYMPESIQSAEVSALCRPCLDVHISETSV
eukprot:43051-Eustigmatos_ZCMA.PRE.1